MKTFPMGGNGRFRRPLDFKSRGTAYTAVEDGVNWEMSA